MKIRRSIFWLVAMVVVLITLVLWLGKAKRVKTLPIAQIETNTVISAPAPASVVTSILVHSNTPAVQATPNAVIATPTLDVKEQQMRQGLAELNDVDIAFYGKVLDQFGSPVANAEVAASIQVNNGTRVGVDRFSLVTDETGSFTVQNRKGKNLGMMIAKSGYVMATTNTLFVYSQLWPESQRAHPDPNNPVVIKMWKLQGAEPLVGIRKEYKLPFTSSPIVFDLISGKVVEAGGDIKITINRPDGIISQQHPQNWSIDFEIVDGGFLEISDQEYSITFAAPENGYQTDGVLGNNNGPGLVEGNFFIRSRNGQVYSKVHLLFGINETPDGLMDITFNGVANTNGSRNWEATAPH